jgi:hypothetical protein
LRELVNLMNNEQLTIEVWFRQGKGNKTNDNKYITTQ